MQGRHASRVAAKANHPWLRAKTSWSLFKLRNTRNTRKTDASPTGETKIRFATKGTKYTKRIAGLLYDRFCVLCAFCGNALRVQRTE